MYATLAVAAGLLGLAMVLLNTYTKSILIFAWNCFLKPISKNSDARDQQAALESFYQGQASIYDITRSKLLQGRDTMLQLSASHISVPQPVWVDIGGGTGWNIERMDEYKKISDFKAVYLIDLSPSLCKIARERFAAKKWSNVHVVCADATSFSLPENIKAADLITMSYSLSMIPMFYAVIDRLERILSNDGIVAVVDFYAQSTATLCGRTNLGGELLRHVNWFSRTFWRLWFEFDRVYLDSSRRDYLEYQFGTIKSVNSRNNLLGRIPYYIWLGCLKRRDSELARKINALATESPYLLPVNSSPEMHVIDNEEDLTVRSKGYEAAVINLQRNFPLPSFFYQSEIWRIFYDERHPKYNQFAGQYIYAFTWEDPREDDKILKFKPTDTVLAITSAGDNILAYASMPNPPHRIHCVDLNPYQNHLLELKLAAFLTLDYSDVWKLFGEGRHPDFDNLLVSKLAPKLSSHALQYWMRNKSTFTSKKGLYDTGSTRWAIRIAKWVFWLAGCTEDVKRLCKATSITEQKMIWTDRIRPAMINPWVASIILRNPLFLWKALGVPQHQAEMISSSSGDFLTYITDTLDPLIERSLIAEDNYFYLLCIQGFYNRNNCPSYLKKDSYTRLAKPGALDGIRIHTDEIVDVVARIRKHTVTIAIVMDHMDWFDQDGVEATKEIRSLSHALKVGGRVLFRSASKHPWYTSVYEAEGFKCKAAQVREKNKSIDRTNMYASTWVATKVRDLDENLSVDKLVL
ncbi:hypothetical protein V1520DRAFT_210244 [Lipomyces starkeyi]|uniref:Methyltransferase type 11 domain-containing protein n=1 Tax=Lipomyces starkeyi NRRL Y-11557 TaxID=675824 RepID=A0A1E3QDA5_LIPST|nr:hypothetical protein LIPSTDRAFT_61259 [Lipomyces starkeyi NRRL Y-11557]